MKATGINFHEWVRRIGVRRLGWTPDVTDACSPVLVTGDHSELVPPVLAPRAIAGGLHVPAVGAWVAFQFTCRSKGGAWVRLAFSNTGGFAPVVAARIGAPLALTVSVPVLNQNFDPANPTASLVEVGEVAARNLASGHPSYYCANSQGAAHRVYIAPGQALYSEAYVVGQAMYWAAEFQEYDAAVPES